MDHGHVPACVDVSWLARHLDDPEVVVLDVLLGSVPPAADRIPHARRFDLENAMSDHRSSLPHTLPDPASFSVECQRLGIDDTSRVIVYDAKGTYASPRARWMLKAAGHARVSVLDGGYPAWIEAGFPTVPWPSVEILPTTGSFVSRPFGAQTVTAEEVRRALEDQSAVVLDARSRARFTGLEPEPRVGLRSGHMPGAMNLPFTEVLDESGHLRPPAELRRILDEHVAEDTPIIVTCGSGVSACVIGLAAEIVGLHVKLYDGSWSEWGGQEQWPVAVDSDASSPDGVALSRPSESGCWGAN